jgi:uncharacterized membrane protein YbaN (DUF454 family)
MSTEKRSLAGKVALTAVGGTLTAVGVAGLMIPVVPGFAFLIPGLALLATEYAWARHLLDKAKAQGDKVIKRATGKKDTSSDEEAA